MGEGEVLDKTYSEDEDEYIVSDIELTGELTALLDKTYTHTEKYVIVSEDEYRDIISDIELTDDLTSVLDKIR